MSVSSDNYEFCWVKRSLYSTAHSAAKYAITLQVGLLCNTVILSPSILKACRQDCCTPIVLLNLMKWQIIKYIYIYIYICLIFGISSMSYFNL